MSPTGAALLLALLLLVALLSFAIHAEQQTAEHEQVEADVVVRERLTLVSRSLAGELVPALVELSAMADWVSVQHQVDPQQFAMLSERVLGRRPSLLSTTLLPGDVIRHSHPHNPSLIGFDVARHPIQGRAVAAMRKSGRPIVTGPINLVQGGRGLILRAPVWNSRNDQYYGHVSMVFDLDRLEHKLRKFAQRYNMHLVVRDSDTSGFTGALTIPQTPTLDRSTRTIATTLTIAQEQWTLAAQHAPHAQTGPSVQFILSAGLALMAALGLYLLLRSGIHLRRTNQQLRAARRVAEASVKAKGAFVASVSHELRTPMDGIIATAELLNATDLTQEQRELTGVLTDAAHALLGLINDVLDFSKLEASKVELEYLPTNLHRLFGDIEALLRGEARKKGVTLRARCDATVPDYLALDPARVGQVLLNLTANAIKFTDDGVVELECSYDADARRVRFSVQDDGIGIADTSILFEDFVQGDASTARRYGGTGLGLAICKRLVTLMGGEVGVESVVNEGSLFWFELPAQATRAGGNAPAPESLSPVATGVALVVDDNKVNRLVAQRALARFGWTADLVNNGEDAIRAAMGKAYDVIFMDCEMPIVDGYEATRRLRARGCQVPIIAMTAHSWEAGREQCLAAGMSDYLTKPIRLESIHAILRCWHQVRPSQVPAPHKVARS